MTTTRTDLLDLAAALRKALGTDSGASGQPAVGGDGEVDRDWRSRWPALAELGIAALCVAEEHEGFGAEVSAALVAGRELGAALHGGPYAGMVAAGYALSRWLGGSGGDSTRRHALAGEVSAGTHVPTLAFLDARATVTRTAGGGARIDGLARQVNGAAEADSFLVIPPGGETMWFVGRSGQCATSLDPHPFDVTRSCADVRFSGAPALPVVPTEPGGRARVELLHGLLLAGDALGGLDRMLDRTVAYARGRTAFGKAIGGFQAVQHRLVDHTVRLRGLSLLADEAAAALTAGAPDAARRVLLAEASVAAGAVGMLHDLLQLTGAIGFTWEYGLHLYERRAHLDARLGGNPRRALRQLAEHEQWPATARPA